MKQNVKQKMKNNMIIAINSSTMKSQGSAKLLSLNFKLDRYYIYASQICREKCKRKKRF